ncbi:MAG: hypothetical protein IAE79_03780 [Anaerolinea sp.]|nr:hypothetical protein [Anaerolinea sp.]
MRPHSVTILLWGVFLIGVWNGGRAFALQQSLALPLPARLDPGWRLVIALIWAVLFISAAVALWQRRRGTPPFTRPLIPNLLLCYALFNLSLFALGIRAPLNRQSWLMETILYAGLVLFSYWTMNRPATLSYFSHKESLERP